MSSASHTHSTQAEESQLRKDPAARKTTQETKEPEGQQVRGQDRESDDAGYASEGPGDASSSLSNHEQGSNSEVTPLKDDHEYSGIGTHQGKKINRTSGVTTRAVAVVTIRTVAAAIRTVAVINLTMAARATFLTAVTPVATMTEDRGSEEKPAQRAKVSIHRMSLQLAYN